MIGGIRRLARQRTAELQRLEVISAAELRERLARREAVTLVDVRSAARVAGGHVDGALHIAGVRDRGARRELRGPRPVATICEGGYRSSLAASLLAAPPASTRSTSRAACRPGARSSRRPDRCSIPASRLAQYEIVSADRLRRHGRGLSRARHAARPRRRAQGDGAAHRVRSGDAPALRDRSPRRRLAVPPQHPVDPRARRSSTACRSR